MRKNKFRLLFLFFVVLCMLLSSTVLTTAESGAPVGTKITQFQILKSNGDPLGDTTKISERVRFEVAWDASDSGSNLSEGDYFVLTIPNELKFYHAQSFAFPLYAPDGTTVIANAVAASGEGDMGGEIKVTFTDYVVGRENIKGQLFMYVYFNQDLVKIGEENPISMAIGSFTQTVVVDDLQPTVPGTVDPNENMAKWTGSRLDGDGNVSWIVRLNFAKANLENAVLEDSLSVNPETGTMDGIYYIEDSFVLKEVVYNEHGNIIETKSSTPIPASAIDFNPGKTAFSYSLGDISGKQFYLTYKSSYKPQTGLTLKNHAVLSNLDEKWEKVSSYVEISGGGNGQGDLTKKIKIIKVDSSDHGIKLKDAKFQVTKVSDGSTFILITGQDGEVISGNLSLGEYVVKEVSSPIGYLPNDKEYAVNLTEEGFVLTVENVRETVDIAVEKQWEGRVLDEVKIKLLADGQEILTATLHDANEWKHTFENLPKYKDGEEIVYTVSEEAVEGYTAEISGDAEKGFLITNREVLKPIEHRGIVHPKREMIMSKVQTGPKTGDPGKSGIALILMVFGIGGMLIPVSRRKKTSRKG